MNEAPNTALVKIPTSDPNRESALLELGRRIVSAHGTFAFVDVETGKITEYIKVILPEGKRNVVY